MQPQYEFPDDAGDELRRAMLDETFGAARVGYVSTVLAVLVNVEDWLAIDSWLGGGKVSDTERRGEFGAAFSEFRAVATVVCMAAELAEGAVVMVEKRRYYAVAAVMRQLIECEYLLTLFNEDLDHARRWRESTPDEVRESFTPAKMRKLVGKFSNEEYWNHCSSGGHPAPKGATAGEARSETSGVAVFRCRAYDRPRPAPTAHLEGYRRTPHEAPRPVRASPCRLVSQGTDDLRCLLGPDGPVAGWWMALG